MDKPEMDLVPCDANARQLLADSLFEVSAGIVNKKSADYVARTFPDILLDIARLLTEQATKSARDSKEPLEIIRNQLKPYFTFSLLLGKCPQITGLMYSYFENSSFQPLPENLFQWDSIENKVIYTQPGFSDELVKEILASYFKYLSFNPKWFSAVWNWGELGRFITVHTDEDIRYLAACCLSVITKPTRQQHISFMREMIGIDRYQTLIDLQIKHRHIFDNTLKPCLETKKEMAEKYARAMGTSASGYSYCEESIAKVANILLLKRDLTIDSESKAELLSLCEKSITNFVPVTTLSDAISKIAYSVSISKPCLLRGPCGSGKTAILDYIAAHTNRVNPPDYVKVQIGDQIDSKLLIGSYICTEIPGQFEWQPGPLTRAMAYGSWIVFEDIDLAPADMAQVIHSVIENGNLSCVSCCPIKLDSPHPDFRIFFTQQSKVSHSAESFNLGYGFVERLCDIVDLPELTDADLNEIVEKKYNFGQLTPTILRLFKTSLTKDNEQSRGSRPITLRDLFKFCDRISARKPQSQSGKVSSSEFEYIYLDAIDCFLSATSRLDGFEMKAEELGQIVNLPANEVQRLVIQRKPDLREESGSFQIGRVKLNSYSSETDQVLRPRSTLAYTRQSLQLLESVSLCIKNREPVLLVGETGVGKTSIVQHLANLMMTELTVINLSQQSDSSDLLGGYKPVELREIMRPMHNKFDELFRKTFDAESNKKFLHHVSNIFASAKKSAQWNIFLKLICKLCTKALNQQLSKTMLDDWNDIYDRARRLSKRIMAEKDSPMALAFSEGSLLRAVKEGKWILLDEINLAEPDVLQCLLLILDSFNKPHVHMYNANDDDGIIKIHPKFRIFACMNPSTDIGKRDLAIGTRNRFTEFFVDDITEKPDLRLVVESYVKTCLSPAQIENVVEFYREVRARTQVLSDISGNSPVFSLRTLCRALQICANNVCRNMEKSLYESLKITFLQQLNETSIVSVLNLIEQIVFAKKDTSNLNTMAVQQPKDGHAYVQVEGFWIQKSNEEPSMDDKYIITKSVSKNLKSLSRIISLSQRRLPILVQGNTSVGKTSLITYLAKLTGNKCYRINNHEHTDLQEYVGRYVLKEDGELAFQEGLLVRAMKKGYWIILDELNLAPCELLEALNRVLDENRELFIPETRETIKAHSKFMIFATQNPPEEYAGRKLLSRAFRNRFIELHFDEIPGDELEFILHKRCEMPPSYAKKIVTVMKELQINRRESGCFYGKNSYMTMRDLFRWGQRYAIFKDQIPDDQFLDWDTHIASEGLVLLEGRARTVNEAETIKNTLQKVFKCKLDHEIVYGKETFKTSDLPANFSCIQFTREFKKLYIQLSNALKYREPVLLCGPTGCGKTTACQLYAAQKNQELITYNCHLNTESSDFVGGVRPMRQQEDLESTAKQTFPWINGPLVEAMRVGAVFLMDEISLADDAVLERINSVLEPTRSITLTEKAGEEIFANDSFRLVATMNPGGDYGKKELSPALRNRFTEIYCHNTTDLNQIRKIIEGYLTSPLLKPLIAPKLLHIMYSFLKEYYQDQDTISIRDVISWTQFIINTTKIPQPRPLSIQEAILNGVSLVFFDQFGTCGHRSIASNADHQLKARLRSKLNSLVDEKFGQDPVYPERAPACVDINNDIVIFKKFILQKGNEPIYEYMLKEFVLDSPMVQKNMMKIVRAMMLNRPILLEGDPGAGKTSIVTALAKLTGHKIVRINLSEQTDISDLFGSDLPSSNNSDNGAPTFSWHDGPLLQAIKESQWVLLDEMNLASQSVLEGLNACFDHRSEIYIPELNKKIQVNRSTTRIFACQNPYSQGAARKGLPQSFLNRFTSIYIESHTPQDLFLIIKNLYSDLNDDLITKMVEFNSEISETYSYSGFEFNLRDILYWCDLLTRYVRGSDFNELNLYQPERFVQFVYLDRMRVPIHRTEMIETFERIFGVPVYEPPYRDIRLGEHSFIMTRAILPRKKRPPPQLPELCILKYQMPYIESIAKAIEYNKMPIIVGESGVGKRSMVRILAGLTGNDLNVIGANREMDTVELLGSFEQKSFQREIVELVEEAKACVISMINSISQKQFASTWSQFFNHIWATLYATSIRDLRVSKSDMMDAYRFQLAQMKELIESIQPLCTQDTGELCNKLMEKINRLVKKSLFNSESLYSSGNFEWLDSILIKSIREGSWLMIEDANLMNPATLDRLNSLVEPNGVLSLNEKGSDSDGIETLVPHPDFRLILTINPEHGELSRAMRNRGIEIYVQAKFYFEDFLMLLNQNGFEPEEKKACMAYCIMQTSYDAHKRITGEEPGEDGSLLAYFGLNYIPALTHHVRRGKKIDNILVDLLIAYYTQRGFADECSDETLSQFIYERLDEYRKTYEVNLVDDRYKWRHLRHDLVSLTGGDAITAMLDRDNRIFFDDISIDLLEPEEKIENLDIVNTCINVKIFLELSTHGDFEYRKGFIRETFGNLDKLMNTVNNHVDLLYSEYIPLINSLLPRSDLAPVSEMHVDSRNSPDIHYYLSSLNYKEAKIRESFQNRWLLSLHRIMLRMIVELAEARSFEMPGFINLYSLSEQVRAGTLLREDLIRPAVEIVSDLFDLLYGLLRVVSNRCFSDEVVVRMFPRFFWIHYFICKLRKAHDKNQLIGICNQLPMLWTLTYQKILVPLIKDCELADLTYKNKKFSKRIQHICDFFDVPITKPGPIEKAYHRKKVLNMYAITLKQCETVNREVDDLFNTMVGRYTSRTNSENPAEDTLVASYHLWSNSSYMLSFYDIQDKLFMVELADNGQLDLPEDSDRAQLYQTTLNILQARKIEYTKHYEFLQLQKFKTKCLNVHRRMNARDQFAPIWQLNFVYLRLAKIIPSIANPTKLSDQLSRTLKSVNGIIMSPKYYSNLIRHLHYLKVRENQQQQQDNDEPVEKILNEDVNMYTAFLSNHLMENIVLDNQVVGWTKLRVTTSDLSSMAPLIPEYSPILSLVSGYCLDITHLKLNSYLSSSAQLDSMLIYLWRHYAPLKLDQNKDVQDIDLAKKLIHLRSKLGPSQKEELIGSYECVNFANCQCVDEYIKRRLTAFGELINTIIPKIVDEDVETTIKSIKLIYFGYLQLLEYAPIFTIDPSLRSREKLEVYRSELAHVKLDLHFRNTLFYWKTGENLQLNEIDSEGAALYPFSTRILVDRRVKLEKAINKLRREYTNRPKSDDGSQYYKLRQEVKVHINYFEKEIPTFFEYLSDFVLYNGKKDGKQIKFNHLWTRSRTIINNLTKTITRFNLDYALYTDLTTNYLVGIGFVLQGVRCLYSRLEQRSQLGEFKFGFDYSMEKHVSDIGRVFSFNNFNQANLKSVHDKLEFLPMINRICAPEEASKIRSILLRTVLIQLNYHITITPSDIEKCIPIVRRIADKFHVAWQERKRLLEQARQEKEELYRYKTSTSTLGNDITYEQQEFRELCAKFPTYDHVYQSHFLVHPTDTEKENLATEEKISNLNRSVDLSVCIDICKAHYKFIKEASRNLLGQASSSQTDNNIPSIDLSQLIKLESEALYSITRNAMPTLDRKFDAQSVECHLLQTNQLIKTMKNAEVHKCELGDLKSSIEILDDDLFDIYHSPNVHEALRFQEFIIKVDNKIQYLRSLSSDYDTNSGLIELVGLITRISSFLITEPLMKFVTGSHALLERLVAWNKLPKPKEDKMYKETDELIELIKSWRALEIDSWRSSLHKVKRKYIDNRLCDLWFDLYEAFNNPVALAEKLYEEKTGVEFEGWTSENEHLLYLLFMFFIKTFLEDSTMGDYQIRLDLVFSFAIQTRFANLYEQTQRTNRKNSSPADDTTTTNIQVDYEKLNTYVYNTYRQYQGLLEHLKEVLQEEERILTKELHTEIRIVAWQGRNLWEIKNNFRISHRKLNKVMNKYLEVLRRPLPALNKSGNLSDQKIISGNGATHTEDKATEAEKISMTLSCIPVIVQNIKPPAQSAALTKVEALKKTGKIVLKLKDLHEEIYGPMTDKFIANLVVIEDANENNSELIQNFHSHKVQDVVMEAKDSKETKENKYKLCRQMYNSKRYAMQNIFKKLQEIGVSYQRGLNNCETLDTQILSLEPLRGMIQNQSKLVLKAAKDLVEEDIIIDCNDEYRKLIANNMNLLGLANNQDLTSEQFSRIRGYSLDMVLDIIKHNRNAAFIYRHLINIQAASTRLTQLSKDSTNTIIYNFNKVHTIVKEFNELVGRVYLSILKLEEFAECYKTVAKLENLQTNGEEEDQSLGERPILKELICELGEENSIMTGKQCEHIKSNLLDVRKRIASVSSDLRDMLNYKVGNHLYSRDDLSRLDQLYKQFFRAFSEIIPDSEANEEMDVSSDDNSADENSSFIKQSSILANSQPGTVLGSLRVLLEEAENELKPKIAKIIEEDKNQEFIALDKHPNLDRLNLRLQKLMRQTMLAVQGIYQEEMASLNSANKLLSESEKRKLKPFNFIDSDKIRRLLRLELVAKYTSDCFRTLNKEQKSTHIQPIVTGLSPILFIYTQNIACFLNIILGSLHLKLKGANRLIPFFTDLVTNGFGLPYKAMEDEGTEQMKGKMSDDNTGFGEGKGETDVSKKLEFESQLDDLKKNDEDKDDETKEDDEPIEAHDDGVEMSEDIGGKAEGAQNDPNAPNEKDENDDEQEEEDENLDDLDKELDTVDQDEGRLDEQLWDDKDEPLGEDDESDLREADSDPTSTNSNKDETKLEAKDENLAEAKESGKNENEKDLKDDAAEGKENAGEDNTEKDDKKSQQEEDNNAINEVPKGEDDKNEGKGEDEGLDLEDEAAQARKDAETENSKEEEQKAADEDDALMDMSISEDNLIVDIQEDDEKKGEDKQNNADDNKSEGELSADDNEEESVNDEQDEATKESSQNLIDDDEIDNQLEIAQNSLLDEKLENPIEDKIRNLPNTAQSSDERSKQEMGGRKVGSHTVYDIFPEQPDDPLDFDEPQSEENDGSPQSAAAAAQEQKDKKQQQKEEESQKQQEGKSSLGAKGDTRESNDKNEMDLEEISDTSSICADLDNKKRDEDAEPEVVDERPTKRTFAEREDEDVSGIKRQKILDASKEKDEAEEEEIDVEEEEKEKSDDNEKRQSAPTTDKQVRHVGTDKSSGAYEVIDLVSESDDDELPILKFPDPVKQVEQSEKDTTKQEQNPADLMKQIDLELNKKQGEELDSIDMDRLTNLWLDCTRRTNHLVHELCQRLQIVLQPTKMSKYKGDYKSGKRLNMRKIISYIASHYRKDKIWLRRTKPSKRTYNITLAVDNSSSMCENNCRQMTYQSLALLAKSLSLIEAGSLSVVSFGEQVKCIHEFGQPYMDAIGAQWLRELRFTESQTHYKLLLKHSCESFAKQAQATQTQLNTQGSINQLLIIISDGRSVSSEEDEIKCYLKQLKLLGVLTLFVVIDDMKNNDGKSVVDVVRCTGIGANIKMVNYMELFPFPFYVILRQLETMPTILGDSLRQWFELVSSGAGGSN